jgi:tetratricopeptide (TPR) repeat protein
MVLDTALNYYLKGKQLSEQLNYKRGLVDYYANYSYLCNTMGKTEEGIRANKTSLQLAQALNDSALIIKSITNLGSSYLTSGKFEEAIKMLLSTVKFYEYH